MLRFKFVDLFTVSETNIAILDFCKNTKNALIFTILVGCDWLTNLSFLARIKYAKKFNSIMSYRVCDLLLLLQTETFV